MFGLIYLRYFVSSPFSFSYCSRVHRDLHSFPTRRSSDLIKQLTAEFEIAVLVQQRGKRALLRLRQSLAQDIRIDLQDRKSTRLNSSHLVISYAVFCLKKKKITNTNKNARQQHNQRAITGQ